MHICHITSGAENIDNILEKECLGMSENGYTISVIAEKGNVPNISPAGVNIYPYPQEQSWRDRFDYLRQFAVNLQADIYQLHSPGLLVLIPFLRQQSQAALIYDMHLPYHDYMITFSDARQSSRFVQSLLVGIWERMLLSRLDGLLFSSHPLYASQHASAKFSMVVYDFPRLNIFPRELQHEPGVFTIIYNGPISQPHGILRLIESFYYFYRTEQHGKLIITGPVISDDLIPMLRETIKYLSLSHAITLLPGASRSESAALISSASVGISPLLPSSFFQKAVSPSFFDYMAAGIPVVASNTPSAHQFVRGAKAGIVLEQNTPEAIAEALKFLYQHDVERRLMGERGRDKVYTEWNWERMQSDLLKFYGQIHQWRKKQS